MRLKTREMVEGSSLYRKHGPDKVQGTEAEDTRQGKEGEEAHESFHKGRHHFRKAPALTFKPKLVKRKLCPLKKLCPRVKVLLSRLGSR